MHQIVCQKGKNKNVRAIFVNNNKKMKRRQKDLEMVRNETQEKAHLETEMKLLRPLAEMRPFSLSPWTKGRKLFAGKCCAEPSAGSSSNTGACTCRGKQRRWSECAGTVKHRGANTHMSQNCGRTSLCVEKHTCIWAQIYWTSQLG